MEKEKKSSRGGARPGAGRPKGSRDSVTIAGLLTALETVSPDQTYEEILIEDFLRARENSDKTLTLKYHNLILNKIMATKMELEVNDAGDALEARRLAFAEALAAMTMQHTNKDSK